MVGRVSFNCPKLSHCASPRYVCSESTLRTVVGAVGELLLDKRISIEDVRTMPEKKEHKKPKPNEGILVAAGWWKEDPERHRLESEGYMLPDLRQNKL
mgnify:CR=1 FL=1